MNQPREPNKALSRFNDLVDQHVKAGMRRSDAQMKAMREHSETFQSAKQARGMQPMSHEPARSM
jgi:hypothetical protein